MLAIAMEVSLGHLVGQMCLQILDTCVEYTNAFVLFDPTDSSPRCICRPKPGSEE